MDLWKLMSSAAERPEPAAILDEESCLNNIEMALLDESQIWTSPDIFLDPSLAKAYRERWQFEYEYAKQKAHGILYSLGLRGKSLRPVAPKFIDAYEQLPSRIHNHNEKLARQKAAEAAQLILPVEGKRLDEQQLLCIAKEAHNHLVLAGAGTGKTTTIVAYVKYLLKKNLCNADSILVLSFTNASASEMSERLKHEIGRPLAAQTFHKLGLDIITAVQGIKPRIYSADIRQFARSQLDILIKDSAYLKKLNTYLSYHRVAQKSEFEFETEEEYLSYLQYNPPLTLKKEQVKSYGELNIATFLFQNGIRYLYEQEYPVDTRTSEYGQYHPDFYLPDYDLYIEYFGINRQGQVPSYFSSKNGKSASEVYAEGIHWKREQHRQYNTRLIELYGYEQLEGQLLSCLEKRLTDAGVILSPVSPEEIWASLEGSHNQKLDRLAELFGTVITLAKSNECTIEELRGRNRMSGNSAGIHLLIDLIEPVYNAYQNNLRSNNEIDFNDMVNLAAEYVRKGCYKHSYSYVIVDEYQDISQSRYRLLDSLREQKDYRLFCVGDDWQSIYRFSGSDIGFILDFDKYWGPSEISRIETTYRFPSSLIKVSSSFIMKNPEQKRKELRSAAEEHGFSVEKISAYNDNSAVNIIAERLKDLPKDSSVLFLGRYRFDVKILDGNSQFTYRYNASLGRTDIFFSRRSDLAISFMTVHSSKGLQADYVFLLNNKAHGMGFPSQTADAPVLQLLLDNSELYPFAEERRLFYVAITRAKKKVWLVINKGNESVFVKELDEAFGHDMFTEQYTCPLCGGRLVRRSGPYGDFYGCSNYQSKNCHYIRNISSKKNI